MVYQWKPASQIKADAQEAGKVCEELERTVGLTAKTLLDASRPDNAPLHGEFEWDDTVAAEAYRTEQARYIIRSLCIKSEKEDSMPVRAFFTIGQPKYESLSVIFSEQEKTDALFDVALRELRVFQIKYATLEKLRPVFDAINQIT